MSFPRGLAVGPLVVLAETAGDQTLQGAHHGDRVAAGRFHDDRATRSGREHHQAHDRASANRLATAGYQHIGIEFFHKLHEFGGCAGVQAFLVADLQFAPNRTWRRRVSWRRFAHLPLSTGLAMVTYLRPAS